MRRYFRASLVVLWIVLATSLLARWWLTHPDAVPRFPESFWVSLTELYGAQNAEEIADVETLVALGCCFAIVCVSTVLAWRIWRHVRMRSLHPMSRA